MSAPAASVRADHWPVTGRAGSLAEIASRPWFLALAGILILIARRPEPLTAPAFLGEEAGAFWAPTFVVDPLASLTLPWDGFAYAVPRSAFLIARLVPATVAPVATFAIFVGVIALLAAFVASSRMADALPRREVRIVAAIGLALLPMASGVYSSVLNVTFWLAIFLALLPLARPSTSLPWRVADHVAAGLAALNGPLGILFAPLYLARAKRSPGLAIIVTVGGIVEAAVFLSSTRGVSGALDPAGAVFTAAERIALAPLGDRIAVFAFAMPWMAAALSVVAVAAVVASRAAVPRATVIALGFASIAVGLGGVLGSRPGSMGDPGYGARYFVPAAWSLLVVASAAVLELRRSGLVLASAFVVGLAWTAGMDPLTGPVWAPQVGCIGGPTPCVVHVIPAVRSVAWPGSSGRYQIPVSLDDTGAFLTR